MGSINLLKCLVALRAQLREFGKSQIIILVPSFPENQAQALTLQLKLSERQE